MMKNFKDKKIKLFDLPENSSDLNPFENLFAICKVRLGKILVYYRDEKMKENCQKLANSIPERVKADIKIVK